MAYILASDCGSDTETDSMMGAYKSTEGTTPVNGTTSPDSEPGSGQKTPYPKGVFFIVANEFCERFSYYGMRAILVLYFTDWLKFNDDTATALYHFFVVLCYMSPILGAVLADGFLGKFRTILYVSIVYGIGNMLMSFTAFPPPHAAGPVISLILIGLGTGGIKPCVSAFGGDQFTADQKKQLTQFFSVFYFAINLGSLFSTVITPLVRQNVHCFGTNCFSLAFGIPAFLMILSIIMFFAGRSLYKVYPPSGNVIGRLVMCIGRALKNKYKSQEKKPHWLDYAADKYDENFIADVRSVLRVFIMYIPLPIFWALFDQQGSRWILQAKKMDRLVAGHLIPPDLMPMINPLMIILLIPMFDFCIYPLFEKCHVLNKPLQRMVTGMSLACGAFVIAGFLQIRIEITDSYARPSGQASVEFINAAPCAMDIQTPLVNTTLQKTQATDKYDADEGTLHLVFDAKSCTEELVTNSSLSLDVTLLENHAYYVVVSAHRGELAARLNEYPTINPAPEKAFVGLLYLADEPLLSDVNGSGVISLAPDKDAAHDIDFGIDEQQSEFKDVNADGYTVKLHTESTRIPAGKLALQNGGIYTVIINSDKSAASQVTMSVYEDVPPNDLSILWQIPQYIVITMGEVLFSISGLSFAYSQAPASMKSVVQAAWLLTVAFGNIVDIIVAGAQLLPSQAAEFFFFAVLMAAVTVVFGIMSYFYRYVDQTRDYELHDDREDEAIISNGEPIDFDDSPPRAPRNTNL